MAKLIFEGGASGGNGDTESWTPGGEMNVGYGKEPGVFGEEELDCVGEENMFWLGVPDMARE